MAFEDSPDIRRSDGLVWIPGRSFTMGSDSHYPEEAPAHPVKVDGFWISDTPVTNRQFKAFVDATGHVTVAEKVPEAKDYPGAKPEMLRAGSLVARFLHRCARPATQRNSSPSARPGSVALVE